MTREDVLFRLPSAQGRAMLAWSVESNPYAELDRVSDGYIMQERDAAAAKCPQRRRK